MKTMMIGAAALAFAALCGSAQAQQRNFDAVNIQTTNLGHNTYMLQGLGGNITVAATDAGVIMVDSEFAPLHDKIKAAIAKVTREPVHYLVNTHFHGDHTGGNADFAKEGVTIVAQENVKKRLAAGTTNGLNGRKTPPAPAIALPAITYTENASITLGGRTAEIGHPHNAHTDGDSYVYFPDANVLATGDIVAFGRYPNIDFANGGGIDGMIAGVDRYLKLVDDNTKIVPGHGPLGNKSMLMAYRQILMNARTNVQKLIAEGKTVDQAVAAKPNAASDAKLGVNAQAAANFVRVVYHSLKRD